MMSVLFKYLASSKNTRFESETSLHIQVQTYPGNPCYQSASILRKIGRYDTFTTFPIRSSFRLTGEYEHFTRGEESVDIYFYMLLN